MKVDQFQFLHQIVIAHWFLPLLTETTSHPVWLIVHGRVSSNVSSQCLPASSCGCLICFSDCVVKHTCAHTQTQTHTPHTPSIHTRMYVHPGDRVSYPHLVQLWSDNQIILGSCWHSTSLWNYYQPCDCNMSSEPLATCSWPERLGGGGRSAEQDYLELWTS